MPSLFSSVRLSGERNQEYAQYLGDACGYSSSPGKLNVLEAILGMTALRDTLKILKGVTIRNLMEAEG